MTTTTNMTVEGERVLSTLNKDGSRRWIRPRPSIGRFLARRRIVAWVLIAAFTLAPYLRAGGRPLFLLDLATRRFTLFGRTFLPTDTLLLALFMVGVFVTVFLLTALFGRVWCGWACPQTVYMEFVYRPIERLFEGTPGRRKGMLAQSAAAKPLKLGAYLLVSMFLAHTFLAWFVGVDRLLAWVRSSPLEHPTGFLVMAGVTGLMLFDFGYFREQTCLVACPYGRFQAALLDQNSLVISYDPNRGEPRGKARKSSPDVSRADSTPGDCVDCQMCVTTCPTGIDIRNGLQMECIGCAQCIDACDSVMTKLGRPVGLIRYSSPAGITGAGRRFLRARVVVYPLILLVVGAAFVIALAAQAPAEVTVLRGLGRPFTELAGGDVSNSVRIKIVNRTDATRTYLLTAEDQDIRVVSETDPVRIEGGKSATVNAVIIAPGATFEHGTRRARLRIADGGEFKFELSYRLVGPQPHAAGEHEHEHEREDHE